jgi:hypothetical protein
MSRRALLLGVDKYFDPALHLSSPGNDVALMEETLARIGYAKDSIQAVRSSEKPLTTYTLRHELAEFFQQCQAGDELLIYFSGHGAEQAGLRLLIPPDYYLSQPHAPDTLINDEELYGLARDSQAKSVVYIVDACREEVKFELAEDRGVGAPVPERARTVSDNSPTVAIVFSCRRGEKAQSQPNGLSYFTQALCTVLGANDECALLCDVISATNEMLGRLLSTAARKGHRATLAERPITGRGGDPASLIIKENAAARLRQRILDSWWCGELQKLAVWGQVRKSAGLASQVLSLVVHAESLVSRAGQALPRQRWRNWGYPLEVVKFLELLTEAGATLSPAEAALGVAMPFVYEAVLAHGELILALGGNPLEPLGGSNSQDVGAPWLALRNAFQSQEGFARRRSLLAQQGNTEAAEDLAAWQMQRFLHVSGELWAYPTSKRSGWGGSSALDDVFKLAPFKEVELDKVVNRLWNGARLVRLARSVFQGFENIELERRRVEHELKVGPHDWRVDELALAHLIALAAGMVIDPRRLSPMLADHLGMAGLFTAERLKQVFANVDWHRYGVDGDELGLSMISPHEVIDATLEDHVAELESHRSRLARAGPLAAIPKRFDARGLQAEHDAEGQPLYHKPHLRLTQDEARVRELLMGNELYRDPAKALRELYQNAMDACRYRRARVDWQRAIGKALPAYSGLIVFRTGDDNGRAYVECRDNGIGMAERHLHKQFAKAGQRFTDSHEFHLERALWEEAGISFTPNSRFGIGVYSYFMMADEILVETKRLEENCVDSEQGLSARVVGSGSLFRLRRAEGIEIGTTVRLYLNDARYLDTLLNDIFGWLWIPEFDVQVVTLNGNETRLAAGQPTPGLSREMGEVVPIAESAGANGQPRLFWALEMSMALARREGKNIVLSDGISASAGDDQSLPLVVVNLTEEYRPELSVDRGNVINWDRGYRWARELLTTHGWRYLLQFPNISFAKIADLIEIYQGPVSALDRHVRALPNEVRTLPFFHPSKENLGANVFGTGLSVADLWIHNVLANTSASDSPWHLPLCSRVLGWRLSELMRAGLALSPPLCQFSVFSETTRQELGVGSVVLLQHAEQENHPLKGLSWRYLVTYADVHSMSIGEVLDIARPLAEMGLAVEDVPRQLSDVTPFVELGKLVTLISRVGTPGELKLRDLFFFAAQFRRTLQQASAMVRPLALIGWSLPAVPDELQNFMPDIELFYLLFRMGDVGEIFETGKINIQDLLLATAGSGYTLEHILGLMHPLKIVGVWVPPLDEEAASLLVDSEVCATVLRLSFADSKVAHHEAETLSLPRLVMAASELSMTLGDLFDQVRPLARLGLQLPDLPEEMRGYILDDRLLELVSRDFDHRSPWLNLVPPVHCVMASAKWSIPLGEVLAHAEKLGKLGFGIPEFPSCALDYIADRRLMHFLEGVSEDALIKTDSVSWMHVTKYGNKLRLDYDALSELLQPLEKLGIRVELPRAEGYPLLQDLRVDEKHQRWYTAADLAVYCHRQETDPAGQIDALQALEDLGWQVDDALAFARYCNAAQ